MTRQKQARPCLQVPPIHVDALWHQRHDADSAQIWLRAQVQAVAQAVPLPAPRAAA